MPIPRRRFAGPNLPLILALLLLPIAGTNAQVTAAQETSDIIAFHRADSLKRGINASIWFAQSPHDYSAERLKTFTTDEDIALMAKLGLDHVRLSIDATPLLEWQRSRQATTPFLDQLDHSVKTMLDHHLSIIIDVHPESDYKALLRQGDDQVERFVRLWAALATHFAPLDPDHIFFEIMNEPEQTDRFRWEGIQSAAAAAIRRAAPRNTIIAAGARWSGLQDLLALEPLGMANVIYTFHDYEPFPFTHQGATWTDARVQPLRAVPYPSTPDAVDANLSQEPNLYGEFFVKEYGLDQWTPERVKQTLAFAAKWSLLHHVPVYCGEFGVLREYSDPAMRAAWIRDMRATLEQEHIGWAMWDYQTNFGLVMKANGKTAPDPLIVQALGLNPSAK